MFTSETEGGEHRWLNLLKYSSHIAWDSSEHKAWVRKFCERLKSDGVELLFDQWDVKLGDDLPKFMSDGLEEADYVLIICTRKYRERSQRPTSGVRFEGFIMTGDLYAKGNQRKFIPVLREGDPETSLPFWAQGKCYVDLSDDSNGNSGYKSLVDTLHSTSSRRTETTTGADVSSVKAIVQGETLQKLRHPFRADACQWVIKESQVLTCRDEIEAVGYYSVLVGLEAHLQCLQNEGCRDRENLITWSLSQNVFDMNAGWFLHAGNRLDPADPPMYDIRHTAEVGIALLLDGRSAQRAAQVTRNILGQQGRDCRAGAWKSSAAAIEDDPLSSVMCLELVARARDAFGNTELAEMDLAGSLKSGMNYIGKSKTERGWKYGGLKEDFWEPWGASIVGFRLGHWLPDPLRNYVTRCLVQEIEGEDVLFGMYEPVKRTRLLVRYLCGLRGVGWDDPRMEEWICKACELWHDLQSRDRDISTQLHFAHLLF